MSVSSSWIHGNALTIESPISYNPQGEEKGRFVLTPYGWGASVSAEEGAESSWFHIPIPTIHTRVSRFERFELQRVFLLFECSDALIADVHIYDGNEVIKEFNDLSLTGNYLAKGFRNTFEIQKTSRYQMKRGLGLSFRFVTETRIDPPGPIPQGNLLVTVAGAEFATRNIFVSTVVDFVTRLVRLGG